MENSTEKPSDSRVDVSSTRLLAESLEVIRELLKYGQHVGPCDNEPKEHEEAWEAPACTLHLAAHKQRHDAAVAFLARASANAKLRDAGERRRITLKRNPGVLSSVGLDINEQMKIIGYILTTIILMVYAAMMNGWALSKLWSWFIVTTFGLPALTIPAAIGLAMVVSYLTTKLDDKKSEDKYWEALVKGAVIATIKPLFALGFGAIVKLWL